MVKYYLDGKEISHNYLIGEILSVFPSIRYIRKMSMLEWVEKKAEEGNERAKELLNNRLHGLIRVDITREVSNAIDNSFYSIDDLKKGNTFLRDFCDSTGCPYNEDTEKAVLKVFKQIIREYNL